MKRKNLGLGSVSFKRVVGRDTKLEVEYPGFQYSGITYVLLYKGEGQYYHWNRNFPLHTTGDLLIALVRRMGPEL